MGHKRNFTPKKGRRIKGKGSSLNTFIQTSYISQGFQTKRKHISTFISMQERFSGNKTNPRQITCNKIRQDCTLYMYRTMWTRISINNWRYDITLKELEHIYNRIGSKEKNQTVVPYNRIRNEERDWSLISFVDLDLNEFINRVTANGALVWLKPQCFCTLTADALQNATFYG